MFDTGGLKGHSTKKCTPNLFWVRKVIQTHVANETDMELCLMPVQHNYVHNELGNDLH